MPLSQGKIRNTISNARDKGSLVILEPYTSGLDQTANSDSADLKSVARKSLESSLPQLNEATKIEPHAAGGIGQRRDINFSRPLTVSSVNEIPSDEEWSISHGPGRFVVQEGHDDVTTYSDNELYDLALRTSSHESILLATRDWREDHDELSNLVATNTASDSTESKDIMEQEPLSSEKARTSQEATDNNTVTYPISPDKRAKPCPKLRGNQRYKIAVVGDGDSGRHALVNQFLGRSSDDEDPRNEDFYCKNCRIDENDVTIEIVDTESLRAYYSMRDDHLRLSHGFIFIYSITSLLSLHYIENLYEEIDKIKDVRSNGHRWPKILLANHTESEASRTVGSKVELDLARKMDCILIESASKNEKAIEAAFHDLVREICYLRYEHLYSPSLAQVKIEEQHKAFAANEPPASRRSLRGIFGWGRP
jgi:GTPase KRas protein